MTSLRAAILVPATTLVLLLAGCGGGGGGEGASDEAKPYVDAMTEAMIAEDDFATEEEARCFAEGVVDVVGLQALEEAGTPEEFTEEGGDMNFGSLELTTEQGEDVYDTFADCGIDLRQEFIDSLGEDDEINPETAACIESALDEETLKEFMIAGIVDGDEAAEQSEAGKDFMGSVMGCMFAGMPDDTSDDVDDKANDKGDKDDSGE